jgi:hypothetical protein
MCSIRDAADQAHARHCSTRAEVLRCVAELAATEAWHGDGARDLASWLAARWQISPRTARELVRDAVALAARPALGSALSAGSISVDQCKALVVLCEEGTDDDEVWVEALPFWSLFDLEREARKKIARELERKDDGTYLRTRHTSDERYIRGEFQLHPEDGAALMGAIDARIPKGTKLADIDHASAVALVELAKGFAADGSGERPTVLLSVSEAVLSGREGAEDVARLSTGAFIKAETARRLSCDARLQPIYTDVEGKITAIGRTSRNVPPALRRAVFERDGGTCTFPGCESTHFLECHHIIHFGRGGPTEIWNLQLMCWTHHTLLHEGKWSLRGEAGRNNTWIRPDGTPFEPRVRATLDTS